MSKTVYLPSYPIDCSEILNEELKTTGKVYLPTGKYNIGKGINIPSKVSLIGEGQDTILYGKISFESDSIYSSLESLRLVGPTDPKYNAIHVPKGCVGHIFRDLVVSGGYSALYIKGTDCLLSNCFLGDILGRAVILSNGANWYERCKIDSYIESKECTAFLQGDSIDPMMLQENHFTDCDFSGPYSESIQIKDYYKLAISVFNGCIFSAPVKIDGAKWTAFSTCEFGANINNYDSSACTVSSSFGVVPVKAIGNILKANNINIS